MTETLTLEFDGGSRGNPGPAGIGIVVRAADGTAIVTLGRFIGRATNNVAEYKALITAMEEALKLGAKQIAIRGDSELIIKQMKGEYRVRHPDMKVLYDQAQKLITQFTTATISHNLRHKNELADKLANLAMDRKKDVTDVDEPASSAAPRPAVSPSPLKKAGSDDVHSCARCGTTILVQRQSSQAEHIDKSFVCRCGSPMSK